MFKRLFLAATALAAATAPAFAHLNPAEHGSLLAGASHPLFGWDHVLVMVSVGIWAAMIGGKALWAVPLAFVGAMSAGFMLATVGVHLPFVEPTVMASVVALGLLVASAVKPPVPLAATLVGAFALFHGYAHGTEMAGAGALAFGVGFALSTAALHVVGLGIGRGLAATGRPLLVRGVGAAAAMAGLAMMAG